MSTGVVTVSRDPEAFANTVAPILADTQSPYVCIKPSRLLVRLFNAAFAVRRFLRIHGAKYVYVRDPWSALAHQMAFPIGGPDLIYDMRGDVAAEARFGGTSSLKHWALDRLVSRSIRHADHHFAVSSAGAEMMANQYGAASVGVIPSCIDTDKFKLGTARRDAIRRELGVSKSDVLVLYSGGSQRYQMLPQMFRIWEAMAVDESIHFLALTSNSKDRSQLNLPADRITRMSVGRDEVPAYLNAADIGFLLREPHPLNTVASPVKFGEYLGSGLAVVSSPGVGDVSSFIEQEDVGILVDADQTERATVAILQLIDELRNDRIKPSQRSRDAARNRYSWEAYVTDWRDVLDD
jgi:glycosyltransferase involved in cell wall biosynthesis